MAQVFPDRPLALKQQQATDLSAVGTQRQAETDFLPSLAQGCG
jgi:hypothetical protein